MSEMDPEVDQTPPELRWLYANGGNHPDDVARWLTEMTPEDLAAEYKRHTQEYEASLEADIDTRNAEKRARNTAEALKPTEERAAAESLEVVPSKTWHRINKTNVAGTFVAHRDEMERQKGLR